VKPESPVRLIAHLLGLLTHRALPALVVLAFLVPASPPTPADEVRALYAAQGLLCGDDAHATLHHETHCVLCMLPATGATPQAMPCRTALKTGTAIPASRSHTMLPPRRDSNYPARAPPSSRV